MGLQFNRPASLSDGKLDLSNGENPLLEFTGQFTGGQTYAYLTYGTDKDPVTGTRDGFKIDIDSDNTTNGVDFLSEEDLSWHSSGNYKLIRISTNQGTWSFQDSQEQTDLFITNTGIDPSDTNLQGFEIVNNRSDRTYPQASISAEAIADGLLDVDAGETLTIKGFLEDRRDDNQPGSGHPYIDIDWQQSAGAHVVERNTSDPDYEPQNAFLHIHEPQFWDRPQWESSDWAEGANAFGQVNVDDWNSDRFRWATSGTWIVSSAYMYDKAAENNWSDLFYWLDDGSKDIYPRQDFDRDWNSSNNAFEISNWSEFDSHSAFKSEHGLDLGTLEFDLKNTTPDITPPTVDSIRVASSLSDGKLDLPSGEKLSFEADVSDGSGTVSQFSNLWVTLRRAYSYDNNGTKTKVDNPEWNSDYIDFYIGTGSEGTTTSLNTASINQIISDQDYKFKNDGDYVFERFNISDNAGNRYDYTKYQGDYDQSDPTSADYDQATADAIKQKDADFLKFVGVDVNSSAFNFRLINPNPDSTLPSIQLNQPVQLTDKVLDIPNGESSKLLASGNIIDLNNNGVTGSGLSHFSFTLEDVSTTEEHYIYISPEDLDSNGNFLKTIDFGNEAPGSFKIKYANISDQAGNSIWYSDDNWNADAKKLEFLNAGFDFDQWEFTLKNNDFDNTPPQGTVNVPTQLTDGILDISNGESALLKYNGNFSDGTGSGFDYFYVDLYNNVTQQSIYLNIGDYEIDANGNFAIEHDASWSSGTYRPQSASIRDKADNYASVWSGNEDELLSANQIIRFKEATGIDLSSNAFNFTVENNQADSTPPTISNLSVSGAALSSSNGVQTLNVQPGTDSTISVSGQISDQPAGFDYLWLKLTEKQSGASVSQWVDAYEISATGDFKLDFDFSYLRSGDWVLGGFDISDQANNYVSYWNDLDGNIGSWEQQQIDKLKTIGVDIEDFNITVNNGNSDSLAPKFSNTQLSFDTQTSQLKFTGDITDDRSGFDYLWLRLEDKTTNKSFWVDIDDWNTTWDSGEENTRRSGSFEFTQRFTNLPSGTYEVTDAEVSDRAGNQISFWRWDNDQDVAIQRFKNSGLDLSALTFALNNPNADLDLPVFTGLTLSQGKSISVESNPLLTISGNVNDGSGSGFSGLQLILAHANGTERIIELNPDSDALQPNGDFSITTDFSYAASGEWSLKEAFLMDEAGNTASYYKGDWDSATEAEKFLNSGIDLSQFDFTVTNPNQADTTLPTITELALPVRDGNTVKLTGKIDDGLGGSGLDNFQINLYNYTIKEWIQLDVSPDQLGADGSFSVTAPYDYLTNAEWRIENIYLEDKAGNHANYWRKGWDADLQSKRLTGNLLAPGGSQYSLDPLLNLTGGETTTSLISGGQIELAFSDVFSNTGAGNAALQDAESINQNGLAAAITATEAIKSELISFNADVTAQAVPTDKIYRFELNLPGDPATSSVKKQFSDKTKGFIDFKTVFTDPLVGASSGDRTEGLTIENDKLVLYVQDNGIFDHDVRDGHITDPFVVTNTNTELKNIVQPKPIARPESVGDEQKENDLTTVAVTGEAETAETPTTTTPTTPSTGSGSSTGGSSPSTSSPTPSTPPPAGLDTPTPEPSPSQGIDSTTDDDSGPTNINTLSNEAIAALSADDIGALSNDLIANFKGKQIKQLSAEAVQGLLPEQISALSAKAVKGFSAEQIQQLSKRSFKALDTTQLAKLSRDAITGLSPAQLKTLSGDELSAFKPKKLQAIDPDSMRGIKPDSLDQLNQRQVKAFNEEQLTGLSKRQINKADDFIDSLSTQQQKALSISSERSNRLIDFSSDGDELSLLPTVDALI